MSNIILHIYPCLPIFTSVLSTFLRSKMYFLHSLPLLFRDLLILLISSRPLYTCFALSVHTSLTSIVFGLNFCKNSLLSHYPSFPYLPSLLSITFSSSSFLHYLPSTPSIPFILHILLVSYHKSPFQPVTLLCPVGFRGSTHRDARLPVEPANEN